MPDQWNDPTDLRKKMAEKSNESLRIIRDLDPERAAACIAGLLTCPELAANSYRLEQMSEAVLTEASGNKQVNAEELHKLFGLFGELGCSRLEDPTEDVFVSLVYFAGRNYRIFEGLWEGNAFHLQRFVNIVGAMPDRPPFESLKTEVKALLTLSEEVAQRRTLDRYCCGSEYPAADLSDDLAASARNLSPAVTFTANERATLGIDRDALRAFSRSVPSIREYGPAVLRRAPLLEHGGEVIVAVPANISTAIRYRVIEFADQLNILDLLCKSLADEYSALIRETPLLGGSSHAPLTLSPFNGSISGELIQRADSGRYVHYLFHMDDFADFRSHDFVSVSPSFGGSLKENQDRLASAIDQVTAHPGFREALTVVVACGWGRGLSMPALRSHREDWRLEIMSIEQLVTLSWAHEIQPLHLFRLLDHVRELERRGVHITNLNGPLNLYGVAESQGFHLVPHSAIEPSIPNEPPPLNLMVPTNAVLDMRRRVAQLHDVHTAAPPHESPLVMRRYHLNSFFDCDTVAPLYASLQDASPGTLRSVYEGHSLRVWLTSHTNTADSRDGEFQFWDTFTKWLPTIVPAIEQQLPETLDLTVLWHIEYEMTTDPGDLLAIEVTSPEQLFAQIETRTDPKRQRVDSRVPKPVFIAFHHPKNFAEQSVLMSLVAGVAQLTSVELDAQEIVTQAIGSEDARQLHLFKTREFADYVAASIPKRPLLIEAIDDSLFRLGVATRVPGLSAGKTIEGIAECTAALEATVDSLWQDVRLMLQRLDRRKTIEMLMLNILSNNRTMRQWERTIRAVLALHGSGSRTMRTVTERLSRHKLANNACRIAIEMAVCESLESGGEEPGELELSRLMALIQMMGQYGGWSDGMMHEAIPARLSITAFGLITISGAFHDSILDPYGFCVETDRLREHADDYEQHFEKSNTVKSLITELGSEFTEMWQEEFGFTIDAARLFLDALEERAIESNSPLVSCSKRDLATMASKHMSADSATHLIDALVLQHRAAWDSPPNGYPLKEIVPWRYKRRLSLVHRPIINLTAADDGPCLCSPEAVRRSVALRVSRAFYAEYDDRRFRTARMRRWIGSRRNQLGHQFTETMAELLRSAGWQCETELEPPQIFNKKLDADYGDVDILAWKTEEARVLIIECKNLFVAQTPGEVARQLAEFRGKRDEKGRPDRLMRHLQRVELLRSHTREVAAFTGTIEPLIDSVLVFRNRVPIEYLDKSAASQVAIRYPDTLANI